MDRTACSFSPDGAIALKGAGHSNPTGAAQPICSPRLRHVSTKEQDLALQLDALRTAGCKKVYEEKASGAQRERPELKAALDYMREGDTLVVWKLDRLARSLKLLIETVEAMGEQGIGLRSLTEAIDTTSSGGRLVFHLFAALAEFERGVIRERTLVH